MRILIFDINDDRRENLCQRLKDCSCDIKEFKHVFRDGDNPRDSLIEVREKDIIFIHNSAGQPEKEFFLENKVDVSKTLFIGYSGEERATSRYSGGNFYHYPERFDSQAINKLNLTELTSAWLKEKPVKECLDILTGKHISKPTNLIRILSKKLKDSDKLNWDEIDLGDETFRLISDNDIWLKYYDDLKNLFQSGNRKEFEESKEQFLIEFYQSK